MDCGFVDVASITMPSRLSVFIIADALVEAEQKYRKNQGTKLIAENIDSSNNELVSMSLLPSKIAAHVMPIEHSCDLTHFLARFGAPKSWLWRPNMLK